MKLKKILLLATLALSAVAFAAPVVAQAAPEWSAPEETENPISGEGSYSWVSKVGLSTGPFNISYSGLVDDGSSKGVITGSTIKTPIATNVPGCAVTKAATRNFPWGVTLSEADKMTVSWFTYDFYYTGSTCAGAGVPSKLTVQGNLVLNALEIGESGEGNCTSADKYADSWSFPPTPNWGIDHKNQSTCWAGATITGL